MLEHFFSQLRAAVNTLDVCDEAARELDYPAADDETDDTAAETCETAESEAR